jgi:hypothetical protein
MLGLKKADCEVDFFFIDDLALAPSSAKPGYHVVGAACGISEMCLTRGSTGFGKQPGSSGGINC